MWEDRFFSFLFLPEQLQQLSNYYGHGHLFVRVRGGKAVGKIILMILCCSNMPLVEVLWFMLDSMTLIQGQIALYVQGHGSVSHLPSLYLCYRWAHTAILLCISLTF